MSLENAISDIRKVRNIMKKCLIVVDYQNDFVSGTLGFPKAVELDRAIAQKIQEYHDHGDDVLFTFDTHDGDYLKSREGRYLPIEHCIKGTEGHALYGNTGEKRRTEDKCFEKVTFGSDELYEYLKKTMYSRIELAGVVTNICVISNAVLVRTAQPETDVCVDVSCVASNDEALNEAALKVMESLQIEIMNERE